jgi:D-alanyl-D-alanine carboxypeptidase/D-alanyl-D-alanine-endopeptidase (penicillin-binding protein 4)
VRIREASAAAALSLLLLLACSEGHAGEVRRVDSPEGLHSAPSVAAPRVAAPAARALSASDADPAHAARAARLSERFRARIAHWTGEAQRLSKGAATASNVRVAACVRELGAPQELVALRADEPKVPASNMKLATTAAALLLFGRGAEWVTPCEAVGTLANGTLTGDLVLRAGGDPVHDPAGRGEVEARFDALARALARAGLAHVTGDVVLDEGSFEDPAPGPGWPDASQHWAEYCALSGGFSASGGVLHAFVRAGRVGTAAALEVHPAPHGLASSYGVTTVAGSSVDVRVGATESTVTVRGTLGATLGEYAAEFAHPDPVALFGAQLLAALERAGIGLDGAVRRTRGARRGRVLAELRSPMAASLEAINAESKNGVADQLFLSLGHALFGEGTRAGGARAVAQALEGLGVPGRDLSQVDGSGLSREDRVTARALCALLERVLAAEPETARLYRGSLAVMGAKGTLAERLRGTPAAGRVFAKTGWIAGVSTLSGYVEPENGRAAVFSILIEYPSALGGLNTSCFKKLQDELVLLLFEAP